MTSNHLSYPDRPNQLSLPDGSPSSSRSFSSPTPLAPSSPLCYRPCRPTWPRLEGRNERCTTGIPTRYNPSLWSLSSPRRRPPTPCRSVSSRLRRREACNFSPRSRSPPICCRSDNDSAGSTWRSSAACS